MGRTFETGEEVILNQVQHDSGVGSARQLQAIFRLVKQFEYS